MFAIKKEKKNENIKKRRKTNKKIKGGRTF